MSVAYFDPNDTEPIALDDRNGQQYDFEIEDELAYNLGLDERDPADDGLEL